MLPTIWQYKLQANELVPDKSSALLEHEAHSLSVLNQIYRTRSFRNHPIDPFMGIAGDHLLKLYQPAIDAIINAIDSKRPICVALDYDCDGQTAGAVMIEGLNMCGADVSYFVPNRLDTGYGLKAELVHQNAKPKSLIVTVDNGITCQDEIDILNKEGYSVVVTDHHLQEGELPKADVILDLKVSSTPEEDEYEAPGVYISSKVILHVVKHYFPLDEKLKVYPENHPWFNFWQFCACLTSLGIVSDVISLKPTLRDQLLVGLSELTMTNHAGLRALLELCFVKEGQPLDSTFLAYSVVPKLNAAGRMGNAQMGLELLLLRKDTSIGRTNTLLRANALKNLNAERKIIEQQIFLEAVAQAEKILADNETSHSLVICGDGWHLGVLGIIAARIVEVYGIPTIILSTDKEGLSGSGRCPIGYNLFDRVQECKQYLTHFGGHAEACGVGLTKDKLEIFAKEFDKAIVKAGIIDKIIYEIDAEVTVKALQDVRLIQMLSTIEPTGNGNPNLIFKLHDVVVYICQFKQDSVSMVIEQDGHKLPVSKYRPPDSFINSWENKHVDILVSPNFLYYTGFTVPEFRIVDIKEL